MTLFGYGIAAFGDAAGAPWLHGLKVAARRDREARFDHVDAELRQLPRHADLLRGIHGEARRLLAVAQSSIENAYGVHTIPQR